VEESIKESFSSRPEIEGGHREKYYSRLYRRFVFLTIICSLVPLLLVGWAISVHYTNFAKDRVTSLFRTRVDNHRKMIELFLRERTSRLQLTAYTHSKGYLGQASNLAHVFEIMNRDYGSITDLGIINNQGRHLAYIGPYDLMDKNYSSAFWFKEVMEKGIYISDMFLGFRKVPHFIIAVMRSEGGEKWILRATIDTEVFRSLVENVRIGKTGEVYLLNKEGVYQTSPRFGGRIMEKAPFRAGPVHDNIEISALKPDGKEPKKDFPEQVVAKAWLKEPKWVLVVRQDYSEAFNEVNHANYATLIFIHLSAATILLVSILITKHMINVIKKRDLEADQLNEQLMQTSKLASIGELSAGVAHEINNPLAIVLTERQILLDMVDQTPSLDKDFEKELIGSLAQIDHQVQRCKNITHNLLRFSRRTKSLIETVDLNAFLKEVIDLMEREAKTSGIKFFSDFDSDLSTVLSDPSQLQQVFLNLITNAIDAHDGKPYGTIRITTRSDERNRGVQIIISDTGCGISQENMTKVFDPFFTTKPVGRGTGLGLSICYSIMKQLGGEISVRSEPAKGTEFTLFLPYRPPSGLQERFANQHQA
jgi:two-component system NtrC family sensor kinase